MDYMWKSKCDTFMYDTISIVSHREFCENYTETLEYGKMKPKIYKDMDPIIFKNLSIFISSLKYAISRGYVNVAKSILEKLNGELQLFREYTDEETNNMSTEECHIIVNYEYIGVDVAWIIIKDHTMEILYFICTNYDRFSILIEVIFNEANSYDYFDICEYILEHTRNCVKDNNMGWAIVDAAVTYGNDSVELKSYLEMARKYFPTIYEMYKSPQNVLGLLRVHS